MQMPNASPQGIAGLMQQRPQAPQMPTPGKASPMAGLGGVDDRVNAYKGDTKPLEKRYAMTQDLLDLLALQKIKSEKDAAARDMQLKMAQQSAESGQANMTVAQQREQEVNELTKNELAQQRGDTAQQQTQQQQDKMKQMMGGIASAPGAAMAAQPKAMAAGGIVGYADGGAIGYAGGGEILDKARERRKAAQQKVYTYGLNQRRQDPEGFQAAQAELQAAQEALQAAEKSYATEMSAAGIDKPISAASPMGAVGRFEKAQAPVPAPVSEAQATAAAGPQAAVPPADKLPPANVVAAAQGAPKPPAPPAPPKPPAPPGIAGLPGAAGAAGAPPPPVQLGAVGPANDFGKKLEAAALKNAEIDPAARQLAEEKRVEERTALTPEQRGVYQEGISGLQGMFKEQYDPERLRKEGIKRALIGAGNRRYGELAGSAEAGMNYDDRMRAAKLKEFGDVQNARTGLVALDRANVKGAIDAGSKTYEQSSTSQRQGLESGRGLYGEDVKSRDSIYGTDVGSRDKALDREIDKLKIAAQRDATAASRESLSYDKARTVYSATLGKVQELERRLDDDFSKQHGMLLMQEQTGKLDPAQKNQLETAKIQLQQQKAKIRRELEPVLESARSKLGVSSSDGFGDMKKVESKK
jgi:hypothetical protein